MTPEERADEILASSIMKPFGRESIVLHICEAIAEQKWKDIKLAEEFARTTTLTGDSKATHIACAMAIALGIRTQT